MVSEARTYIRFSDSNHDSRVRRFYRPTFILVVGLAWLLGPTAVTVRGQKNPLEAIGIPFLSEQIPVQNGLISATTGNLHLEFPLGSVPQRSGSPLTAKLVYDSELYQEDSIGWNGRSFNVFHTLLANSNGYSFSSLYGWEVVVSGASGYPDYNVQPVGYCSADSIEYYYYYKDFAWTAPDGTYHYFPIQTAEGNVTSCGDYTNHNVPTGDAFADDASGYHMYVTGFTGMAVYAPDGTLVSGPQDTNGNYLSPCSDAWQGCGVDSLGKSPFTTSSSGPVVTVGIMNSQGTMSSYRVTLQTINVHTNFGLQGHQESAFSTAAIQSIQLPDGTSYSFGYDSGTTAGNYGQLTSMTLPTGGTIHYSYANFADSFYDATINGPNIVRILNTMTTPDGQWTLSPAVTSQCSSTNTNCQQTITITKPAYNGRSDQAVYKSRIFGGAWPIQIDYYTGAVSPSNLNASVTRGFDLSHPCNKTGCFGARGVTEIAETVTLPTPSGASVHQTTQYCHDFVTANLLYKWEWNFYTAAVVPDPNLSPNCSIYPGLTPDRTTAFMYLNGASYLAKNIVSRATAVTVTNSSGATVAQTLNCYDYAGGCGGASFINAGNVVNHNTSFGTSYTARGDLTQIKRLVTGTSNYLFKSMTYDTTGQLLSETDWSNTNPTTYNYGDNFFNDAGDGTNPGTYTPTALTNAYLKTITHPAVNSVTAIETFGYYWGTGQKALSTDPNNQTTYFHFYDPLNRATSTKLPNTYNSSCCGWAYAVYPNASETQVDTGIGITSTSRSVTCTGTSGDCRHDQTITDNSGRTTSTILVSDPDGQTIVNTAYDSNGRIYSVSNPHRATASPTDGTEYYSYDGLGRKIQVTGADGSIELTYYGATIGSNGRTSQLCSGYGVGYPILHKDQAAHLRQTWADGFGRLIEVDEPDSTGSLSAGAATCYSYDLNNNLTGVVQGSQTRSFSYDMLSRLAAATNPESGTTNYYYTTSGGLLCSGDPSAICRRTDARSITTTYAYDALSRLISKSYSDSTSPVKYGYDAVAPSGCTPPSLTITNGKGRRTSMCDGPGQTAWSYDQVGNTLVEKRTTNSVTDTVTYTYNLDNSTAAVLYPSSRTITYQPGGAQRSLWGKDITNSINYAVGATYAPFGGLKFLQNGVNLGSTLFYNTRLQPCRISVKNSGTAPITCADSSTGNVMDLSYNFNLGTSDNGNVMGITNKIDGTRSQTFTYDSLNRVATAAASTYVTSPTHCWGEKYTIDRYGNLTGIGSISSAYTGCVNAENLNISVSATTNRVTTSGFTYDSAGNLTSDGIIAPQYDAEGHVTLAGGVTYYYDGDGRRVRKSNGKIYWYGTSSDPILETDGSGNLTYEYIFFGGKRIARRDASANISYYLSDHLGTARVVTNSTGTVQDDSDFYPYGGERVVSSATGSRYKFTGKERDSESGFDNFGARYNSSQYGRFLSPDPMGGHNEDPQTLNRYSYVRNNPLNLTDPTGLDFYQECKQEDDNKQMCNTVAGYGKRTFYGTTQNGQFKPTVITSASLEDANSGNTARVDENGVQLTTKNGTSQGVFITGTPAANNIQGKGALLGFSFNINGNCRGDCLNSGTFKFSGTPAQARAALKAAGSWNYGFWDALNSTAFGHHPYSDQFRFGSGPSAHLSVPWDIIPGSSDFGPASIINPLSTVPATGDFHTDPTVGFEHAKCSNIPGVSCN